MSRMQMRITELGCSNPLLSPPPAIPAIPVETPLWTAGHEPFLGATAITRMRKRSPYQQTTPWWPVGPRQTWIFNGLPL